VLLHQPQLPLHEHLPVQREEVQHLLLVDELQRLVVLEQVQLLQPYNRRTTL
jgi:hypothetical protein